MATNIVDNVRHRGIVTHLINDDEDESNKPTAFVWSPTVDVDDNIALILPDDNRADITVGSWVEFDMEPKDDELGVRIVSEYNVMSNDPLPTRVADNGRVQVCFAACFLMVSI